MEPEDDGIMSYKTYADISNVRGNFAGYSDAYNSMAEEFLASQKSRVERKVARQEARVERKERAKAKKAAHDEAIKKVLPAALGIAAVGIAAYLMNKKKKAAEKEKAIGDGVKGLMSKIKSNVDHIEDEIEVVVNHPLNQFTLIVKNSSSVVTRVSLFGSHVNLLAANYGNDQAISIQSVNSNSLSYARLLNMIMSQPFEINAFRFRCDNPSQFDHSVELMTTDMNGMQIAVGMFLSQAISPNQYSSNIVDLTGKRIIDASTQMSFMLKPNTEMSITFFLSQNPADISDIFVSKDEDANAGVNFLLQNGLLDLQNGLLDLEPQPSDPFNKGNIQSSLGGFETNEGMPIIQGIAED